MDKYLRFNLLRDRRTGKRLGRKKLYRYIFNKRTMLGFLALSIFAFVAFCAVLYFGLPDVGYLKKKNPPDTAYMRYRLAQANSRGKKLRIRQEWVAFDKIPKLLKEAVRFSEDAGFYWHKGIDYHELEESIKKNVKKGKKARGGSTITMQLARNLYLSPRKSYLRKIREILIAKKLEKALSKNRIFHLYLNIVELGPGIFGFQTAAKHYFARSLEELDLIETLSLVAVLPKPLKVNPRKLTRYVKWRIHLVGQRLFRTGRITEEEYELIKELKNKKDPVY